MLNKLKYIPPPFPSIKWLESSPGDFDPTTDKNYKTFIRLMDEWYSKNFPSA